MEDSQETKKAAGSFVRKKALQTTLREISQQMYARNKELADTNKMLSLLRAIDMLVLESHASVKSVAEDITKAITEATGYPFSGLFIRPAPNRKELTLDGWSAKDSLGKTLALQFERPLQLQLDSKLLASTKINHLIPLKDVSIAEMAKHLDYSEVNLHELNKRLPLRSLYIVKLVVRHHVVGLLAVGFLNPVDQITEQDTRLLDRLSESIGVALDNKLLIEENQHVLRQLRESNAKLRALDEAKDDFISMASHQLRTPLTSVKGYLSMVLDGDVGELNENQQKLLTQSFISSQRMVYLIADLLNLSRLNTGKFVIERAPVNIAEVVQGEVNQLVETAKSRGIALVYKKPKSFPELMLDDTKIHQVVMNFMDNAIYYTKSGGTIHVEAVETPTTVEYLVKDDGIGVPKAEQHHLFSKFYRAENAKKARPDGTGLGLFMAKKVIDAQGGAIIFESEEGKGSTFGFRFSKDQSASEPKETKAISIANE